MCLRKIEKRFTEEESRSAEKRVGYKFMLYNKYSNEVKFPYFHRSVTEDGIVCGKNYRVDAITARIYSDTGTFYERGFHVFDFRESAVLAAESFLHYEDHYINGYFTDIVIAEVEALNFVVEGIQDLSFEPPFAIEVSKEKCFVAREIKFLNFKILTKGETAEEAEAIVAKNLEKEGV